MAEVTDNAIIAAFVDARLDGQQLLLTTYWKMSGLEGALAVDAFDAIDAIHDKMSDVGNLCNVLPGCYSEDVENIQYIYQWIHPTRLVRVVKTAIDTEGQVASPAMPPGVAHVLTLRTEVAGPNQRANKHLGGVPTSFTADGYMTAAGVTAYTPLGTALKTEVGGITVDAAEFILLPILFRRTDPASSEEVDNFILGTTTRCQRRRTVGLGS